MNLRGIVNGYVQPVNSDVTGDVYASTGAARNADYSTTPGFVKTAGVALQVQALSGSDLRHLEGLNQQVIGRAVYINGVLEGVDRPGAKGGDVLNFSGQWWLVTTVLEPWTDASGWTKVAVTLQNGKPPGIA